METATPTSSAPTPHESAPAQSHKRRRGFSLGRFFLGLIVIIIGLSLLSESMGWGWFHAIAWWKLWPVLIILIGISLLGRGGVVATTIGILVGIGLLLLIGLMAFGQWNEQRRPEARSEVSVAREAAAKTVELTIRMGAGALSVRGGSAQLMDGTYTSNVAELSRTDSLLGDIQQVMLRTKGKGNSPFWFGGAKNTLDLNLTNDLPVALSVDGGAMTMNLDLTTVRATKVNLDAGASTINLILGDVLEASSVSVDAGASTVTVSLPRTLGARLDLDSAVSKKNLPEFVQKNDSTYESAHYTQTAKKVDLTFDVGASTVNVIWR